VFYLSFQEMNNKKRTPVWDRLTLEERRACTEKIIRHFSEDRETQMGILAAEEMLDFFLETLSDSLFNKGVDAAQETLRIRFQDIEIDLDALRIA
jgi:uncharacterized protein (DUF2164 family)